MKFKSWLVFLFSFCFISCVSDKKKEDEKKWKAFAENIINSHTNKKITLPDSVEYGSYNKQEIDSILSSPVKIVFNVDLDCITCLMKFDYWKKMGETIKNECGQEVPMLAYINSSSDEDITMTVNKLWEHGWVYDKKYLFIDSNGLNDDRFQAVLLDKDNVVKLIGNPMQNEALGELYKKTIITYLNEK